MCGVSQIAACPSLAIRSEFGEIVLLSFFRAGWQKVKWCKTQFFAKAILPRCRQDTTCSFSSVSSLGW